MPRSRSRAAAMPLIDHLRELRRRLIISAVAILLAVIPAWLNFDRIFAWVRAPFDQVVAGLNQDISLVLPGVLDPFSLQVQLASITAVIAASPVWLVQLWRFVTPGLHRREKLWTYGFLSAALPLLAAAIYLCYQTLPVGLRLLLGLTPDSVQNLIPVDKYIDFVVKMSIAFSIGFLSPLVMVMLNFAGLLTASAIRSWWRGIILIVLLFAAIATPTGDPFNMLLLAMPILGLIVLAWGIAALNDWRRGRQASKSEEWEDDEASDLDAEWS